MLAPRLHELTRRLFIVFLLRHTIITRLPPGLPALSPIIALLSDIAVREMACHSRTLAPSKVTRDDVHASTYRSTPSLSQLIQHTEQENERLQRRVACQHRMEEASMDFLGEVRYIPEWRDTLCPETVWQSGLSAPLTSRYVEPSFVHNVQETILVRASRLRLRSPQC